MAVLAPRRNRTKKSFFAWDSSRFGGLRAQLAAFWPPRRVKSEPKGAQRPLSGHSTRFRAQYPTVLKRKCGNSQTGIPVSGRWACRVRNSGEFRNSAGFGSKTRNRASWQSSPHSRKTPFFGVLRPISRVYRLKKPKKPHSPGGRLASKGAGRAGSAKRPSEPDPRKTLEFQRNSRGFSSPLGALEGGSAGRAGTGAARHPAHPKRGFSRLSSREKPLLYRH